LDEAEPAQREALLHSYLVKEVTRILRLEPTHAPDPRQGFIDMGMDSLMAVELRDRLQSDLGLERPLTPAALFNYPTIEGLTRHLAESLTGPRAPCTGPSMAAAHQP